MRFIVLPFLLLTAFLPTILLPKQGELMPSALRQHAPEKIGEWKGFAAKVTKEEKDTLASDTIFVKKIYILPADSNRSLAHKLACTMVFSGHDVNNSIHQPEICLPAQGHFNLQRSPLELPLAERPHSLPIQRIHSQLLLDPAAGKNSPVMDSLTYYFFVGHSALTNEHQHRTAIDIKDRLIKGYDQRWAFVMISMPFGEHPDKRIAPLTEQETDTLLSEFCAELVEQSIDWNMIPE